MKKTKILLTISIMLFSGIIKATEKDLYDFLWLDPDKKVFVLQNKIHKKANTVYFNLGIGSGLSSNFQNTSLLHSNAGYSFNETWALEGMYSTYTNKDNDDFTNLKKVTSTIPFIRNVKSNYGILAKWSPFYGKINTFNQIFYFDWAFGAGLGKINTESNALTADTKDLANIYANESYTSIISKTEFMVHINTHMHLNAGILFNTYMAPGPIVNGVTPSSKIRNNMDIVFGIGFSY